MSDFFSNYMSGGGSIFQPRVISTTTNQQPQNNNSTANKLITDVQTKSDAANKDSLAQYQQLLKAVQDASSHVNSLYGQAQDLTKNLGNSQMQQLKTQQTNNLGSAEQSAVSRGLGNTTIRQGMLNGVNQSSQLAQNALSESVAGQKANLLTQQAGAGMNLANLNANAITAKQNQGPDISQYLNLLMALGGGGK